MLPSDLPELGVVRIARPCSQKWSAMKGDARVRRCAACKCNVFNFAEISSEEARQLIRKNSEGERICARIFTRFDGTVLTKDCPRGYSHGWRYARKLLPRSGPLMFIAAVLVAAVVGTAALLGDNLRRLNSMSGAMEVPPKPDVHAPKLPPSKRPPDIHSPN